MMSKLNFLKRHVGPSEDDTLEMLKTIGVDSIDSLVNRTVPSDILSTSYFTLPEAMSEYSYMDHIREVMSKNKLYKSYIGLGYYDCIVPSVIARNIFENPGWYTQYTPYQAEISQGRLEALLNFQTLISDLTAMEVANASLLDEGTAAAEAMTMLHRLRNKNLIKRNANNFFVSEKCFPQTIDVLRSRSSPLGIELVIGNHEEVELDNRFFGALVQYPDSDGLINDYSSFIDSFHKIGALVAVAADLLSLTILIPPGEMGADVVVGSSQRFGVPMGYGGPHAAYFATKDDYKRQVPGRMIGVSIDKHGKTAYRMALQTREQHIRREKATSNICTAQSLLSIMAGMYGVYHGPQGLKSISYRIHKLAVCLERELVKLGFKQVNKDYFDTLLVDISDNNGLLKKIKALAENEKINFRYGKKSKIWISLDETTRKEDLLKIVNVFSKTVGLDLIDDIDISEPNAYFPKEFKRKSEFLKHPVFNQHHSETKMLRYIKSLENRDLSLAHSMIPLGSCTMKLNGTTEMIPLNWPEVSDIHPFAPVDQTQGYQQVFTELENYLCEITGFSAASLQPNSGAQGEYAGLVVVRAYHEDKGDAERNVVLVPSSAHGTNPASAVIAGMKIVVVKCDSMGNIDIGDLKEKCKKNKETLAAIMITYPSTHGVFETDIKDVCSIVHENGGQVYMDGANLNAQVGLTNPAIIGADVCHINLHKTFSIPHGGGGPGMGPICVAEHLVPYLPDHCLFDLGVGKKAIHAVSSAPWGSASILLISYAYIRLLGEEGVREATKYAILNANYLKSRLENYYPILYKGKNGRVAHEFILDFRAFKKTANVDVEDVAKRLMDYGFHAPTMSWPVPGTLMIEPTESESKDELDRFCEALIEIHNEISEIEEGKFDREDNVLKNAPHTVDDLILNSWGYSYPKEKAYYPLDYIKRNKFWTAVGRIDNAYGDKNLVCTCPPVEEYMEND